METKQTMDFPEGYDRAVQLTADGSVTNMTFLSELSQSNLELPDGSPSFVGKANSGRLSPLRSRTMKEYEAQIGELKKENFSLKLRIYYLDDRMQQKYGADDVFKTNIELKVELDSVKKDCSEKQEIIKKASVAMQSLTHTHQEEMAQLRQQHQSALRSIQSPLEKQLLNSQQELFMSKKELENAENRIKTLEAEVFQYERHRKDADNGRHSQEKEAAENQRMLEDVRASLNAKTARISQLQAEVDAFEDTSQKYKDTISKLESQIQRKQQELEDLAEALQGDNKQLGQSMLDHSRVQDELAEKEERSKGVDRELTRTKADLGTAQQELEALEESVKKKDKAIKDLENDLGKKQKELESQAVMGTKLKKTIQALTLAVQEKVKEASGLCTELEKKEEELKEAREELHALNLERLEGVEKQHGVGGSEMQIEKLTSELKKVKQENERLKKSLSQRDGETSSFKDLLTKAEQGLKQSEEAVQVLQDQLEKERQRCTDKMESQTQHYQALLGDSQRQLENKERMLQQLTESLKDKDRQLQDCMMLMKPAANEESKDTLLKKFQEKLKERDRAIEEAIEDKFKSLEEKDKEIREMKITLRERDRDIERANQMLLNAEESIDSLENEIREKDKNIKQLSNRLRSLQKGGEDALDNYNRSVEEKDAIIKRLQSSLAAKDKALEEASQMSPDIDNVKLNQLQQRLTEKDKLMAELIEERNHAAQNYEASMKDNHKRLKDKENEIKQLSEAHNEEMSALAKDLQRLQSELNKKDYELQTSENRATWAEDQQQDMLDNMRHALQEKDKTIEALVESGKEKDKLFRQMQGSQSLDQSQMAVRLAELQNLKEELALLRNELQNKDDLVERLKRMKSPTKSHLQGGDHTSTHEIHRHIERVVEDQSNETRRLNEALQNERQIYINLNTSDPQRSLNFDAELAAVKSLRSELEEGVQRNNKLRDQLETELQEAKSVQGNTDKPDDAVNLKEQLELLRTQLEESKRLNASLQSCLQENQKQRADDASNSVPADISVNAYSFAEPSSLHLDESLLGVLSSNDLKKTVKDLHDQLSDIQRNNLCLKSQLAATESLRDVPGENNLDISKSDASINKLKKELAVLRERLSETEIENRGFRFKFGLVPDDEVLLDDLPNVDELQAELLVMKSTLDSIENVNNKLKKQVQVLSNSENIPPGLNPALVESMVKEIDKLKSELGSAKEQLETRNINTASDSTLWKGKVVKGRPGGKPWISQIPRRNREALSLPQVKVKSVTESSSRPSRIPVYKRRVARLVPDIDRVDLSKPEAMHALLKQYRQDLVDLQNKLTSTEATVRTQGRRCRYYKALLDQEGILPSAPYRSQSESCLFNHSALGDENLLSASSVTMPEDFKGSVGNFETVEENCELTERVKNLKQRLEEKNAEIESLKSKVVSGDHTCISDDPLGVPANRSSPLLFVPPADSLQQHVVSLQQQLSDSQKVNKTLLKTVQHLHNTSQRQHTGTESRSNSNTSSQTSPDVSRVNGIPLDASALQEKDLEICSLKKQLAESQNICAQLSSHLEELGQLVIEYVGRQESDASKGDNRSENSQLLHTLNTTQDLIKDLSTVLDAADQSADGGVPSLEYSFDVHNKYQRALQEIKSLKSQLSQSRSMDSRQLLAEKKQQDELNEKLRDEVRSQQCVLQSQSEEIARLQNYTDMKNREVSQLQGEVKSLQERMRNLQVTHAHSVSTRSAAVGESRDGEDSNLFCSYNNNKETETESVYSDESWDALEREGYRPVGSTSNANSRRKLRGYQLETDSMDSDEVDADHRPARPRFTKNGSGSKKSDKSGNFVQEESEIERGRHASSGVSGQHSAIRGSTEGFALGDESSLSSLRSGGNRSRITDQGSNQDIFARNGLGHNSRQSQGSQVSGRGLVSFDQLTDHTYNGVAIPDMDRYSLSGLDSDTQSTKDGQVNSTSRGASLDRDSAHSITSQQNGHIDLITAKLKSAEVVNKALKDELQIYQNIGTSIGVGPGVISSPMTPGTATQTSLLAEDLYASLVQEHLAEVRAMRIRLEVSLSQNDKLRSQLERQLAEDGEGLKDTRLRQEIITIQTQLTERERLLREKHVVIENHEKVIHEKNEKIQRQTVVLKQKDKQLTEKESMCKKLQQQRDTLSGELKSANKEVNRLKLEKNHLNEQLQENQDLNKTLRFELEMFESMEEERSEDHGSKTKRGFDIREWMTELRRLRIQLDRCIETNNSLRQKLEEHLGQVSPRSSRGTANVIRHVHSTDSSRPDSKDASDGMPSPDAHRRYRSTNRTVTERYVEEQKSLVRSMGSHGNSQGSHKGSQELFTRTTDPHMPFGSSVELNRSSHSSDGSGHLVSGFDTLGSQNSQSSEEREVLFSSLHSPRGLSRTWPHTGRPYDSGMSVLGASLPGVLLSPGRHQRSLSVRHASEGNMTYHVYDPPASLVDEFPGGVDPDIRHLFAVGKVDDYEHLKKENNECRTVLSGVQARIMERLSRFKGMSPSQSIEYSTLKELSLSVENLRMCLGEENRLINLFWVTQLPASDDKGEFYSPKLLEKNDQLQSELYMLQLKYNLLASAAKDAQTRLHATNRQKEDMEEAVIQQLSRTEKVLRHARGNLETKAKNASRSKPSGKQLSASTNMF